jgi:hypothetical protein
MKLAVSKLAIAAIGATAVAAVALQKPKPKNAGKRAAGIKGFKAEPSPNNDHPICKKYPQGAWAGEGYGYVDGFPKGSPGWTEAERDMIRELVKKALDEAPPYTTLSAARDLTFEITRSIIRDLCPSIDLPPSPLVVENYLKQSLGFRWMWSKIGDLVWDGYVVTVT